MLRWLRILQDTLISKTRMEYKRGRFIVVGFEVLLTVFLVIPFLIWILPTPLVWDLVIIFGTPLLLIVGWKWSGRVDPNEVTDNPLSVVTEALDRTPQESTLPFDVEAPPQKKKAATRTTKVIRVKKRSGTAAPDPDDDSVRVRRGLKGVLHAGEKIELAGRLHYSMLFPTGTVTVAAFAAIFYVRTQPKSAWYLMVALAVAFAVIVGFPIYRKIRHLVQITRWWHILLSVAVLTIAAVVFRAYLPEVGRVIVNTTQWLLRTLQLYSLSLESFMWLIFWVSLAQLILRFLVWWLDPIVVTNQRLFETRGLIVPKFPSATLTSLTDETPRPYWPLRSVGTLVVETPGQVQGITKVYWFPLRLLREIHTTRSVND